MLWPMLQLSLQYDIGEYRGGEQGTIYEGTLKYPDSQSPTNIRHLTDSFVEYSISQVPTSQAFDI